MNKVPYEDKGLLGDPFLRNLKEIATDIADYIPKIDTEVRGVDLSDLTDDQKSDIACLIAIRGVVLFRNQKNLTSKNSGSQESILHKHATTSSPKCGDFDDVHVAWTDENRKISVQIMRQRFCGIVM